MEMHFEFTDVRADRAQDQHPPAAETVRAADTDRQADVGQQVHGATNAATLAEGRDHEALAQRGDAGSGAAAATPAEGAADGRSARNDIRPAVRVRRIDAADADTNPGPAHPAMPADRPDSVGFYPTRYPEHVRVFQLDPHGEDAAADQQRRAGADTAPGDQGDSRLEVSHDESGDTTMRRFATDMTGSTSVEAGDASRAPGDTDKRPGEATGEAEPEGSAEAAADEGDGKNTFTRALGGVLRVTGRVISDASGSALEAYRQGPGERMLEDQLERRAEKVGRRALRAEVREAKRGAPLLERRYAANNIKYHAGAEIKRAAKREYKDAVRASWQEEDGRGGEEQDEQDS